MTNLEPTTREIMLEQEVADARRERDYFREQLRLTQEEFDDLLALKREFSIPGNTYAQSIREFIQRLQIEADAESMRATKEKARADEAAAEVERWRGEVAAFYERERARGKAAFSAAASAWETECRRAARWKALARRLFERVREREQWVDENADDSRRNFLGRIEAEIALDAARWQAFGLVWAVIGYAEKSRWLRQSHDWFALNHGKLLVDMDFAQARIQELEKALRQIMHEAWADLVLPFTSVELTHEGASAVQEAAKCVVNMIQDIASRALKEK